MKLSGLTSSIIIFRTLSKSRWLSPGSRKGSENALSSAGTASALPLRSSRLFSGLGMMPSSRIFCALTMFRPANGFCCRMALCPESTSSNKTDLLPRDPEPLRWALSGG